MFILRRCFQLIYIVLTCKFGLVNESYNMHSSSRTLPKHHSLGRKALQCFVRKAGTVKRLIYTGSVVSASPVKDDGTGFNDVMDETCWTPLNDSLSNSYSCIRFVRLELFFEMALFFV